MGVSEPSADELGSLEQKKIVRNKGTRGTVPLLRVTFQNVPFQDSFPRAWQVAMPCTSDGLRCCSLEGKEDWCDWVGNGWQCSCKESEERRVQCDIYSGHRYCQVFGVHIFL